MRIGLMVQSLTLDDPVSDDVTGTYVHFHRKGIETHVFTSSGETPLPLPVLHFNDVNVILNRPDDLLIYHHRLDGDMQLRCLRQARCRVVVKHHGSPSTALTLAYSGEAYRHGRLQREALHALLGIPYEALLTATAFEAAELKQLGAPSEALLVLPSFHRIEQALGLPDDSATLARISAHGFNILAADAVMPGTGLDLLLDALDQVLRAGRVKAHLHVIGDSDVRLAGYAKRLTHASHRARAKHGVTFHGMAGQGSVTGDARATYFRNCDLFWAPGRSGSAAASIIEAMAFGLPVLASGQGVTPEVCLDAAIYADTAAQSADALEHLIMDDGRRIAFGAHSRRRYEQAHQNSHASLRVDAALEHVEDMAKARVPPSSLALDGDWFGLPDPAALIGAALAVSDPLPPLALTGRDRRLDFVDWTLKEGRARSAEVARILASPEFLSYARDISVPSAAVQLDPGMRLTWRFNRFANAGFSLRTSQSVADFIRWHRREIQPTLTRLSGG